MRLKELSLIDTQVSDAGCAALASALDSGAMPDLESAYLDDTPASAAAKAAVYEALARMEPLPALGPGTPPMFGAAPAAAPAVGGLFGAAPAATPAAGGLFGAAPAAPAAAPAAGGLFGATPAPAAAPAAGGLFGATPAVPAAAPAGGGLFGATPAAPAAVPAAPFVAEPYVCPYAVPVAVPAAPLYVRHARGCMPWRHQSPPPLRPTRPPAVAPIAAELSAQINLPHVFFGLLIIFVAVVYRAFA